MFSEVLQAYEDLMEPGKSVVLRSRRTTARRASACAPTRCSASTTRRIVRTTRCASICATRSRSRASPHLKKKGDSPVSLIVIKGEGGGEVEIALPKTYQVSPPIAGAVKAIPGVVDVELV
jgi:DNA polymerase-3 subunit alpha